MLYPSSSAPCRLVFCGVSFGLPMGGSFTGSARYYRAARIMGPFVEKFVPYLVFDALLSPNFGRPCTLCWRRGFASPVSRPSTGAFRHDGAEASGQGEDDLPSSRSFSGRSVTIDQLWRNFFSNPSQWFDNRSEKVNPRYPDFTHRKTQQGLWIDNRLTPRWVEAQIAVMVPGCLKSDVFSWNKRMERCVKAGDSEKVVVLFQQMQREEVEPDEFTFVPVLKACSKLRYLEFGKEIHREIIRTGHQDDMDVANCLVHMYARCGSMEDAHRVFKKMHTRSVATWNAVITGYVKCREGHRALELSSQMELEGVDRNCFTFLGMLNACASIAALEEGRHVHEQIIQLGYDTDVFVGSSLVNMYAKCGSIDDARQVFNKMHTRDVVVWGAMLVGYVKCGKGQEALELYRQMQLEKVNPDSVSFVGVLNACASLGALEDGRCAHRQIIASGFESDVVVGTSLVDMYAKCGSIEDARCVFNNMSTRDLVSWNSMIMGYAKCGNGQEALKLSRLMPSKGINPNPVTFVGMLNACASIGALEEGRGIHEQIIERGYESHVFIGSSLVDMYAKCGSIEDAWWVFIKMPTRDVVAWNTMLMGCVKCGEGQKALKLYQQMLQEAVDPDPVTFVGLLNACASIGALEEGQRLHGQIIDRGYELDVFLGSSLLDMYAKCGRIEDAQQVFENMPARDVVAWSAMLIGFVKCGQGQMALELSLQMQREGVDLNAATFVGILNACATVGALEEGKRVHEQIIERGFETDLYVGNSLVDMYAKCGSIEDAQRVFNKMPTRDVVAWNSFLMGCVKCGEGQKALELYRQMQQDGVDPDPVTFVGVMNACASLMALKEGRQVHGQIIDRGCELDVYVGSSLVDMYAKCGSIEDAQRVFNKVQSRDVVVWNAMLAGYGTHGYAIEALQHFKLMLGVVEVDSVSFNTLLSACSHGGLVDEALHYFESMVPVYNIIPTVDHYTGAVALLGRAGRLHEAEDLIRTLPCEPGATVWMSLLGACRIHGNMEMGEYISKPVLKLDPENAAGYVLLSNIYAASGK